MSIPRNVLIIEVGGSHMENVYTLVHLLCLKKARVSLLVNHKLRELIREKEKFYQIYDVPDTIQGVEKIKLCWKIRNIIKKEKIDILIFGTVESKPVRNIMPFLPGITIAGIIHDAQKMDRSGTFRYVYPFKIKKYIVFGNYILNGLHNYSRNKLFPFFPSYFPKPAEASITDKKVHEKWIVLPGGINSNRKDYIPLLEEIKKKPLPPNLKLIFLGKLPADEEAVATLIQTINAKEEKILFFYDTYVCYDQFHRYMLAADFILPLIKIESDSVFSNTRVSGAYHLAYGYHVPLLLPASYATNTDLTRIAVYYDNFEALSAIFDKIAKDDTLADAFKPVFKDLPFLNYENEADKLMQFLNG